MRAWSFLKCYALMAQARNISIAAGGSVVGGGCRSGGFSPARSQNAKFAVVSYQL